MWWPRCTSSARPKCPANSRRARWLIYDPTQHVSEGLDVPELFKQVLDDLSEYPQANAFGYNIDVLAPQNFNEVMYAGFAR